MTTKMTSREFFTTIAAIDTIPAELKEYAENQLLKMDERNKKQSETLSPAQQENLKLVEEFHNTMEADKQYLAAELGQAFGISVNKASAILRMMVAKELATVEDVKVPKKGTQKAYTVKKEG